MGSEMSGVFNASQAARMTWELSSQASEGVRTRYGLSNVLKSAILIEDMQRHV
jgi:hypothetical protein